MQPIRRVRLPALLLALALVACRPSEPVSSVEEQDPPQADARLLQAPDDEVQAQVEPFVPPPSVLAGSGSEIQSAELPPFGLVDSPPELGEIVAAWMPPPFAAPLALRSEDHFYFIRPIETGQVNWPLAVYRYGSTYYGEQPVHTGVDMGAARGADIRAAAAGTVIWTGYGLYRGEVDITDPYGLAVAIEHDFGFGEDNLFTVYAHMQSIDVWVGQYVETGEKVGELGDTGRASGPHLHFEIRKGENRFLGSRNPELWMVPNQGTGVLAGRIRDRFGEYLYEHSIQIRGVDTGRSYEVMTYARGAARSDDVYQENFAIGDLPSGPYEVRLFYLGQAYTSWLYVYPGQTNYLTFYGSRGFEVEPRLQSAPDDALPYP